MRTALILLMLSFGTTAQSVTASPATVVQAFPLNGQAESVTVALAGSGPVTLSTVTRSGGNWLSVIPTTGALPLTATIGMDPSGLPDGTYLGSVNAGSSTIPVIILVGNPGPQLPPDGIVNAASYQGGAISPGEIITIFGANLGPPVPYSAQIWDGVVTNKLAGARVWIGGTAAPVVYAYPNQIAVVVPYEVAGQTSVTVQAENLVARTPSFSVPVRKATPAYFTADSSGTGQLAALNQDYSYNSPSNPAVRGAIVVLYATGMGTLNPAVADGTVIPSASPPALSLAVEVTIGGQAAQLLYQGAAPGLVAGAIQINAQIPDGIASGAAEVVAMVGGVSSPKGCTISVR